jgi:hypothetical protein
MPSVAVTRLMAKISYESVKNPIPATTTALTWYLYTVYVRSGFIVREDYGFRMRLKHPKGANCERAFIS